MPTVVSRYAASSSPVIRARSFPPASMRPELGRSRPPIRWRSVDFPEPDLPNSATRSPRHTSSETPRRATTDDDADP